MPIMFSAQKCLIALIWLMQLLVLKPLGLGPGNNKKTRVLRHKKGVYQSIEEGVNETFKIYKNALKEIEANLRRR